MIYYRLHEKTRQEEPNPASEPIAAPRRAPNNTGRYVQMILLTGAVITSFVAPPVGLSMLGLGLLVPNTTNTDEKPEKNVRTL